MYDFSTGEIAADSRLNIKHGKLTMDNRGDYWIFNHTGCLTYITADSGKIKEFRLIPQDKLSYIDFERYHIVHDLRGIIWKMCIRDRIIITWGLWYLPVNRRKQGVPTSVLYWH